MESIENELHPKQIEAFRRMNPARKLELAARIWFEARELKAAAFGARHPDWSEAQIRDAVREVFLHART